MELRRWQIDALDKFVVEGMPQDFCVEATPGAGKTTMALQWSSQLRDQGIDQLLVFVPTRNISAQWVQSSAAFGWGLIPNDLNYRGPDIEARVTTYQALSQDWRAEDLRRFVTRAPTAIIMDEYHHLALDGANGSGNKWGARVANIVRAAGSYRLHLSGTPWREPGSGQLIAGNDLSADGVWRHEPHFRYSYGEAIRDGVCRVIQFAAYDAKAQWTDLARGLRRAELSADPTGEETRRILDGCLKTHGNTWLPDVIREAHESLSEKRRHHPDAAALFIAEDRRAAKYAGELIEEITGVRPVVVVTGGSDDQEIEELAREAHARLNAFAHSSEPWLVAVGMVSEGVDIPRLRVGVYGTRTKTALGFRQIVGRFVRRQGALDRSQAELFMPAVPELMEHGREIELSITKTFEEQDLEEQTRERIELDGTSEPRIGLGVDIIDGGRMETVYRGVEIGEFLEDARQWCEAEGVSSEKASALAVLIAETKRNVAPPAPEFMQSSAPAISLADEIRYWQDKVENAARRRAFAMNVPPKQVNGQLIRAFGGRRPELTVSQLRASYDYVLDDRNWA